MQGAKGRWCQPMPSSRRWTHAAASRPADACDNSVRSIMAKCLWYFEKAHRNRIRQHLKAGERQLAVREAEAQQAIAFVSQTVRDGEAPAGLVRQLYRAGDKVRPYRPQDVARAAGAFRRIRSRASAARAPATATDENPCYRQ